MQLQKAQESKQNVPRSSLYLNFANPRENCSKVKTHLRENHGRSGMLEVVLLCVGLHCCRLHVPANHKDHSIFGVNTKLLAEFHRAIILDLILVVNILIE